MTDATTDLERSALDAVDVDELVATLQDLVRHRSENPPGDEGPVAARLAEIGRGLGLLVEIDEVLPGRPNVVLSTGDAAGPELLFLAHTDTVPAGDGWTTDPFGGELVDGRVHGRGSADMKGGLVAALHAMAAIVRAGIDLPGRIVLAATVDEEEGGDGAKRFVERRPPTARWTIVPEPTELQTIVGCRGDCYVDVEVHGHSAHAGSPEQGRNAIHGAVRVIDAVRSLDAGLRDDVHPLLGSAAWSVGLVHGGTGTAMIPDHCRVSLDRRLLPGQRAVDAQAELEEAVAGLGLGADDLRVTTEILMEQPPFALDPEDPLVLAATAATRDAGAPDRPVEGWSASCDGAFLAAAGVPTIVLGPGSVVEQAHKPDESIPVGELVLATRAYVLCALRLLGAAGASPAPTAKERTA